MFFFLKSLWIICSSARLGYDRLSLDSERRLGLCILCVFSYFPWTGEFLRAYSYEDHHSIREQANHASMFQVSDYITSANITLAKASHLSNLSISGIEKYAPPIVTLHTWQKAWMHILLIQGEYERLGIVITQSTPVLHTTFILFFETILWDKYHYYFSFINGENGDTERIVNIQI